MPDSKIVKKKTATDDAIPHLNMRAETDRVGTKKQYFILLLFGYRTDFFGSGSESFEG